VSKGIDNAITYKKIELLYGGYPVEHRWVIATSPSLFSQLPIRYLLVITARQKLEERWGRAKK